MPVHNSEHCPHAETIERNTKVIMGLQRTMYGNNGDIGLLAEVAMLKRDVATIAESVAKSSELLDEAHDFFTTYKATTDVVKGALAEHDQKYIKRSNLWNLAFAGILVVLAVLQFYRGH